MKTNRFWSWLVFLLGAAYFIVPLIAWVVVVVAVGVLVATF